MKQKYIAACCPNCGRPILYSENPRRKARIKVRMAAEGEPGDMFKCSKCDKMLVKEIVVSGAVHITYN